MMTTFGRSVSAPRAGAVSISETRSQHLIIGVFLEMAERRDHPGSGIGQADALLFAPWAGGRWWRWLPPAPRGLVAHLEVRRLNRLAPAHVGEEQGVEDA